MDYNTGFYCFFTGEGKQLQLDVHKTLINLSKYTRISKLEVGRMTFETIENVLNINTDAIMNAGDGRCPSGYRLFYQEQTYNP